MERCKKGLYQALCILFVRTVRTIKVVNQLTSYGSGVALYSGTPSSPTPPLHQQNYKPSSFMSHLKLDPMTGTNNNYSPQANYKPSSFMSHLKLDPLTGTNDYYNLQTNFTPSFYISHPSQVGLIDWNEQ